MEKVAGQQPTKEVECAIKRVQVSCSNVVNYLGEKNYRTVYRLQEIQEFFIDTELINKRYTENDWMADATVRLFWFNGKQAECVAEKNDQIMVDKKESLIRYETLFAGSDFRFKEGIFRVTVEINGVGGESDDLYVMGSHAQLADYFQVTHVGIDKCCEETVEESNKRPHSFRGLDITKLQDVRFYFLAHNQLKREWVYEFFIHLLNRNGGIKTVKIVKSGQYIKDPSGNPLLCFAIDLGEGVGNFWEEDEYILILSCFDQLVLTLSFTVGNKEVPYRFESEILSGGKRQPFMPLKATDRTVDSEQAIKDKEEVMDRLYQLAGLRKVKEEITQICNYAEFIQLRRQSGFSDDFPNMHMVFTGHPGTGKNTVAKLVGELFYKMGILTVDKITSCQRKDLVKEGIAAEEQLVRQVLTSADGGILFIEDGGDFFNSGDPNDRGIVVLHMLFDILIQEQPQVVVILACDTDEFAGLEVIAGDLKKIFPYQLYFEDYTPEELMDIARKKMKKRQFRFTPGAEEKFLKLLKKAYTAKGIDFTNGCYIDEQIEDAAICMSKRVMANHSETRNKDELMLIREEDIIIPPDMDRAEPLERLKSIVGLKELKQNIAHHLNYIYFIHERQKHGFSDAMPPLSMIFSGNPGTGKMTVAKMMGEIYYSIGVLSSPKVTVHNGQLLPTEGAISPEQGAMMLWNAAEGGILYIDEADTMIQNTFGVALLEALLSFLSTEENGDTIIILAGYADNMEKMLQANSALKNYFPYQFQFNDYEPAELLDIAVAKLKEKNYIFHPKAKEAFQKLIQEAYEKREKRFGNALLVEKFVGIIIRNMSERTMKICQERELTYKEITTIMAVDIPKNIFEMPKLEKDVFDETEITLALKDLDKMVGQSKIKSQIRDFVELTRHYSQQGVKLTTRMSLQWCFTGNSGMGKGTVARIIGRLYKAMGIVNKGHVLDFKVEKLIGQTEDEAQRGIGEALALSNGGIFLFDEDSPKLNNATGFKERIRAILMNQMAERPGAYTVIYAKSQVSPSDFGEDTEHMSEIINMLIFEDYTKEELMQILKRRLDKENMRLTRTARQYMTEFVELLLANEERSHTSARMIRVVADLIVRNCVQRLAKNGVIENVERAISVQKRDVETFTDKFIAEQMNERKKIGYRI